MKNWFKRVWTHSANIARLLRALAPESSNIIRCIREQDLREWRRAAQATRKWDKLHRPEKYGTKREEN
jgi:hypothetical protein